LGVAQGCVEVIALGGGLGPHSNAVPDFFVWVSVTTKKDVSVLALSLHVHNQQGIGLGKAGEVEEVAREAKREEVVPVANLFGSAGDDDQSGLVAGLLGNRKRERISTSSVAAAVNGTGDWKGLVN